MLRKKTASHEKKKSKVTQGSIDPDEYGDVTSALSLNIETLLEQSSTIHAMHQRWSERVAEDRRELALLTSARDLRLTQAHGEARRKLELAGEKPTDKRVETKAKSDADYLSLVQACHEAQATLDKSRGVVSALEIKHSMAKASLFAMGQGDKLSNAHSESVEDVDLDVSVNL